VADVLGGIFGAVGGTGGGRTDTGWITSTTIQQATAIAISSAQISSANSIANKQYDIAKRYIAIAEELQSLWRDHYKKLDIKATAESHNEAVHAPDYDEQAGRYAISVRRQFAEAYKRLEQCTSAYCTGLHQMLTRDIVVQEAKAIADAVNYAYRYAEHRAESLNDRRWSRMTQMVGLGKGIMSTSLSYSQSASAAYSSIGGQLNASIAGLGRAIGYTNERDNKNATPPTYQYQTQGINPLPNATNSQTANHNSLQFDVGRLASQEQARVQSDQFQQSDNSISNDWDINQIDFGGVYGAGVSGDK